MRDWEQLRAQEDIQFSPVEPVPQRPPPDWLREFMEWWSDLLRPVGELLGKFFGMIGRLLGVSSQVVMWLVIALAALLVIYIGWRVIAPWLRRTREQSREAEAVPAGWAPDSGEARALLEDADRLAAEGRFEEATHLLLKRSVEHIEEARPGLLEPSSTAREIAGLASLSEQARAAFSIISMRVERSLFALRPLTAEDWHAARAAYADFALSTPKMVQAA